MSRTPLGRTNLPSRSESNVLRGSVLSYNQSHAEEDVLDHLYPVWPDRGFLAAVLVGLRRDHPYTRGGVVDRLPQRLVLGPPESLSAAYESIYPTMACVIPRHHAGLMRHM